MWNLFTNTYNIDNCFTDLIIVAGFKVTHIFTVILFVIMYLMTNKGWPVANIGKWRLHTD